MSRETGETHPNLAGDVRAAARGLAAASQSLVDGVIYGDSETVLAIARLSSLTGLHDISSRSPSVRGRAAYVQGANDALSSVLSGLQERGLNPNDRKEFERRNAIIVLREIAEHPGFGVESLVDILVTKDMRPPLAQIHNYCRFLKDMGFIEPALPIDGTSAAWSLTGWGIEIYEQLKGEKRKRELRRKIDSSRQQASLNKRVASEEAGGK
jgi:hypothetical protein